MLVSLSNFSSNHHQKPGTSSITLLTLLGSPQSGEQSHLSLTLGDLGHLPGDDLLVVDQEGEDVEEETVSHVDNTTDLGQRILRNY